MRFDDLTKTDPRLLKQPKWIRELIAGLCNDVERAQLPKAPEPVGPDERTASGYRIFAKQKHRRLRVVESTLTSGAAYCWLFAGGPGHQSEIQVGVQDAETYIAGLARFVLEARAGTLHAPGVHALVGPSGELEEPPQEVLRGEEALAFLNRFTSVGPDDVEIEGQYPNERRWKNAIDGSILTHGSPDDRMPQTAICGLVFFFTGWKAEAIDKVLDEGLGRWVDFRTPRWFNRKLLGL